MFRLTQPLQTMILRSTPLLLRGVPLRRAATKTVLASVAPSLVAKKRQQSTQQTKRSTISSARVPAVTEKKTKKFVRKIVQKLKTAAKPKIATKKTVTKIVTKSATESARKIVRKPFQLLQKAAAAPFTLAPAAAADAASLMSCTDTHIDDDILL